MTASKSSYARVNGLTMYYEIHGEGQPLVLLVSGTAIALLLMSFPTTPSVNAWLDQQRFILGNRRGQRGTSDKP